MIRTIMSKELRSYFRSPMSYVIFGLFSLMTGWIFFNFLITFVENTQRLPAHMRSPLDFYTGVVFRFIGNVNILFVFIVPLISMNSLALEFKTKTIEIYYKSLINDTQIILGKFLSIVIFCFFIFSITFIYPILLDVIEVQDFTFVYTSYLAMILNILAYASIGIFASSMTSNPIAAGLMCFVGIMSFWMVSWGINISDNYFLVENLKYITFTEHFERIAKGVVSLSDVFYYLSFIFTFLFLAKKKIESRKWRTL